jgi:hypothetical protein
MMTFPAFDSLSQGSDTAKLQGDTAKLQGDTAKLRGDTAKLQGDTAKLWPDTARPHRQRGGVVQKPQPTTMNQVAPKMRATPPNSRSLGSARQAGSTQDPERKTLRGTTPLFSETHFAKRFVPSCCDSERLLTIAAGCPTYQ